MDSQQPPVAEQFLSPLPQPLSWPWMVKGLLLKKCASRGSKCLAFHCSSNRLHNTNSQSPVLISPFKLNPDDLKAARYLSLNISWQLVLVLHTSNQLSGFCCGHGIVGNSIHTVALRCVWVHVWTVETTTLIIHYSAVGWMWIHRIIKPSDKKENCTD